jgi:hypothetical protein
MSKSNLPAASLSYNGLLNLAKVNSPCSNPARATFNLAKPKLLISEDNKFGEINLVPSKLTCA